MTKPLNLFRAVYFTKCEEGSRTVADICDISPRGYPGAGSHAPKGMAATVRWLRRHRAAIENFGCVTVERAHGYVRPDGYPLITCWLPAPRLSAFIAA